MKHLEISNTLTIDSLPNFPSTLESIIINQSGIGGDLPNLPSNLISLKIYNQSYIDNVPEVGELPLSLKVLRLTDLFTEDGIEDTDVYINAILTRFGGGNIELNIENVIDVTGIDGPMEW